MSSAYCLRKAYSMSASIQLAIQHHIPAPPHNLCSPLQKYSPIIQIASSFCFWGTCLKQENWIIRWLLCLSVVFMLLYCWKLDVQVGWEPVWGFYFRREVFETRTAEFVFLKILSEEGLLNQEIFLIAELGDVWVIDILLDGQSWLRNMSICFSVFLANRSSLKIYVCL